MTRPGWRRSLQLDLVVNLAGVMTAGLFSIALLGTGLALRTVEREAVDRLRLAARQLERVSHSGPGRLSDLAALAETFEAGATGGVWRVVDRRGREVWLNAGLAPTDEVSALVSEAWERGEAVRGGFLRYEDLRLVLPVRTPRGDEGALVGTITVAVLWDRVRSVVEGAGWVLVVTAVVFVMFGAYLLRRRIVMPLREISRASARIAEGRLTTRLDIPGAHELADLGRHFNRMAESLEDQREALVAAERSLARSERLASVGRLAAGVAHEVGNPVAAILGFSEVALRDPEISDRTRDALMAVKSEALRIRSLIRELLDLARSGEAQLEEQDLGAALGPIVDRMRAQCDQQGVDVRYEQTGTLPPIRTDLRRMEQIVVNLIENALHAAREVDHGVVRVRAHPVSHASATAADPSPNGGEERSAPVRPTSVALEVIDNGPGIPAENLPRVFDPFFTTKDPGAGTGLGLWNAHRWAELLGGHLEVFSSSGQTRFILFLPTADSGSRDERDASAHH